jgi:hypothetical protein
MLPANMRHLAIFACRVTSTTAVTLFGLLWVAGL